MIRKYKVVYRGGLANLPKSKSAGIDMQLTPESFMFEPTMTSRGWWDRLEIPYRDIRTVEIVPRNVSTLEGIVGGLNSRQLNQDNNIHITWDADGTRHTLRMEMITGVSVMAQARQCREFIDLLRTRGITEKFRRQQATAERAPTADVPEQIEKLARLRDSGILSEDEFQTKKRELLDRI